MWSLNRTPKILRQYLQSLLKYRNFKFFVFFSSALLFSIQLFSIVLVKAKTLTNSKPSEFLHYLNSFSSYKQKMNFYF